MLPEKFLSWNYFPRGKTLREMAETSVMADMNRFLLNSVRHNPALCTAFQKEDGTVAINAKIVGIGYVLKKHLLEDAARDFEAHLRRGDELFAKAETEEERREANAVFQKDGAKLLTARLYFEDMEEACAHVDFSKMATIELALSKPNSSKHTWQIVQHNQTACLLFYQPPTVSFELHGKIEIHENDAYHKFVNLVHDSFHYAPPERRSNGRKPVYLFNVEEVYDNSASKEGFGTKIEG
ncbi:MAG: hypothetical protein QXJ02_06155 [Candidatus Bathyarchaeia archaeon]